MSKLGAFAAILLVTMVGCSVNPQGQTVINDQAVTLTASVAATSGFIALSANQQTAVEVIPAAQLTYEVASAVNTAAKGGVPLAQIDALAKTYINQANPGYAALVGYTVDLIEVAAQPNISSGGVPSTQPSSGDVQELLIDASQGVMNAALVYTGGVPSTSAAMGVEYRGGPSIVVRHFRWMRK